MDYDYDYDLVAILHTRLQFLHNQLKTKVSLFEINKYSTSGPGPGMTFLHKVTLENYKLHPDAFEVLSEKKAAQFLGQTLTVVNAVKTL